MPWTPLPRQALAAMGVGLTLALPWRAQAAELVPGFTVSVYAQMPAPVRMAFDAGGVLYVGNGSNSVVGAPVFRVAPGGGSGSVSAFGPAIYDADAVLLDTNGTVSGVPGALLVAGTATTGGAAVITAIRPDQTAFTVLGPIGQAANPGDMALDSTGRLLFTDSGDADPAKTAVFAASDGVVTRLFVEAAGAVPDSLVVGPGDRIVTSASDGTIRIRDASGVLLNGSFVTGLGAFSPIELGRGGAFGTDLVALDRGTGDLLRIDSLGARTVIGTGFATDANDLAFGPDGALYVSMFTSGTILRIAPVPEPSTWLLLLAGVAGLAWRQRSA